VFGALPNSQTATQLLEGILKAGIGCMEVFAFRYQLHFIVAQHPKLAEGNLKRLQVAGIYYQQLVLVKLDLNRLPLADYRHPGAAIVHQQVFEVAEITCQDRFVDMLAVEVAVARLFRLMTRFEHYVNYVA
jgi:hypothetical protein